MTDQPRETTNPTWANKPTLQLDYPENILNDIGIRPIFGEIEYEGLTVDQRGLTPDHSLSVDQRAGLDWIIESLSVRDQEMLRLRYQERLTFQAIGDRFGFSRQRAQQATSRIIKKLRAVFIREVYKQSELALMIKSAEEMKSMPTNLRKIGITATEDDLATMG